MGRKICKPQLENPKLKENTPSPPWINLPGDITTNVLHRLGAIEIMKNAEKVCSTWWRVCKDPLMWRVIDMKNPGNVCGLPYEDGIPTGLCVQAVDRSKGELIEINIEHFCSKELLLYICERSRKLKRLTLAMCHTRVSSIALRKACVYLPELEELHLSYAKVSAGSIEAIGKACPMLKSFSYYH